MKYKEKEEISTLLRYEVTEKEPCGVSRHGRNVYVGDGRLHFDPQTPGHNSWKGYINGVSGGGTASSQGVACVLNAGRNWYAQNRHDFAQPCGDDAGTRSLVLILEKPV